MSCSRTRGSITGADQRLADRIDQALLEDLLALVPEAWLADTPADVYVDYLMRRLQSPRGFVKEAESARADA